MFDDLLLNEITRTQLKSFVGRPAHGLLITGSPGTGKKHLARHLAANLLRINLNKLEGYPHFFSISKPDDKSEIPIESTRSLISKLNLKVPSGGSDINRVAIIFDAELLSHEAQNSLLKSLEEPPLGSLLIFTSSRPEKILPTVLSRLQTLSVRPVSLDQSRQFFNMFSGSEIESAWFLSSGAASLMAALLEQGSNHKMKQAVDSAKKLLSLSKYDRLSFIQSIAKNKLEFESLLEGLSRVLNALQQANVSNLALSQKVLVSRKIVLRAQDSLDKNTNVRLLGLELALRMPL